MRFIETWTSATLIVTHDLTPGIRELLLRPEISAPPPIRSAAISMLPSPSMASRKPDPIRWSASAIPKATGSRCGARGFARRLALHVVA